MAQLSLLGALSLLGGERLARRAEHSAFGWVQCSGLLNLRSNADRVGFDQAV